MRATQVPLRAGAKAGAAAVAGRPSLGDGLEAVSTRDWSDEKAADSNGEEHTVGQADNVVLCSSSAPNAVCQAGRLCCEVDHKHRIPELRFLDINMMAPLHLGEVMAAFGLLTLGVTPYYTHCIRKRLTPDTLPTQMTRARTVMRLMLTSSMTSWTAARRRR